MGWICCAAAGSYYCASHIAVPYRAVIVPSHAAGIHCSPQVYVFEPYFIYSSVPTDISEQTSIRTHNVTMQSRNDMTAAVKSAAVWVLTVSDGRPVGTRSVDVRRQHRIQRGFTGVDPRGERLQRFKRADIIRDAFVPRRTVRFRSRPQRRQRCRRHDQRQQDRKEFSFHFKPP